MPVENLEEVVVTASKSSENLQDVPMSVQAIGAAELDLKNVKGSMILLIVPAVTWDAGARNSTLYQRCFRWRIWKSFRRSLNYSFIFEQPLTTIGQTLICMFLTLNELKY